MRRSIIATVAILVVLVAAALAPWGSGGAKQAADQFVPPTTWLLVSDEAQPLRLACLGTGWCPTVERAWEMPLAATPTTEDVARLFADAGYEAAVVGTCGPPLQGAPASMCSAQSEVQGFAVTVIWRAQADDAVATAVLTATPADS